MIPNSGNILSPLWSRYIAAPDQEAVVFRTRQGDEVISVSRLIQGAAGYASLYLHAGIAAGDVLIDLLPPGKDLVFAFWGALIAGAIPSILPFQTERLDPKYYREMLRQLMVVTRPSAVIAQPALAADLRGMLSGQPGFKGVLEEIAPSDGRTSLDSTAWIGRLATETQIAVLQHSSGTTGLQKGVALSHQSILNQLGAYAPAIHLLESDVVVSWLPLYHDMGLIAGFLLPILTGAKLVLMSPFDWIRAPWMLFEAVSDHGGTLTWLPNFAFNHCAQSIPDRHLQGVDLSSWRGVINCSEPMFLSSHRAFITRFAPYGLRPASLATCYAMAENVFAVTQSELSSPVSADRTDPHTLAQSSTGKPADGRPSQVEGHLSAGRPLANCRVKTVGDDGLPVGERQIGEIAIQSDCLLSGYYQRPDATSAAFRDGWFMTGDLGYVAAGEVYITGRKKDVIIVGGKNIYPQDLEEIANRVRGVKSGRCVAFGIPDPAMGTEEIVIVAEKDMDDKVADDRLEMELRKVVASSTDVTLGRVKIVGSRWLVKTSSGKLARRANREKFLKDLALGGSPEET